MKTENSCRICGGDEYKLASTVNNYHYVICSSCDVTRQYPYPTKEETDELYSKYLQVKKEENPLYMSADSWNGFKKIKDMNFQDMGFSVSEFRDKKILDVGCATGLFLQYAESYGALATGIDISPGLIEIARQKGLNCSCKTLFEVEEKFDLINFSHVIEHVDDPIKYLNFIYSLLNENGILVVETPCTGIISKTFAESWRFYMPIEHLHLFSQKSLFNILASSGFILSGWVRFGSGNTSGSIPDLNKKVSDTIAKTMGIGDNISVLTKKSKL